MIFLSISFKSLSYEWSSIVLLSILRIYEPFKEHHPRTQNSQNNMLICSAVLTHCFVFIFVMTACVCHMRPFCELFKTTHFQPYCTQELNFISANMGWFNRDSRNQEIGMINARLCCTEVANRFQVNQSTIIRLKRRSEDR